MPDIRNSIPYDHDFWYTCVKWWYIQAFFSVCQSFDCLGCYCGKRAKNGSKWQKNMSVELLQAFFSFLLNFEFLGFKSKRAENSRKWQTFFCLSWSVSQEPYIIWSSFVVCKCKMIISRGFFFIFCFKFWFLGF